VKEAMTNEAAQTKKLKGFQRRFLRAQAHHLQPVVQVGQGGLSDSVLEAVDAALLDHELIKIKMEKPEDKKGMATELAQATSAELCGLVGHTAILYRAHPKKPKLKLPTRDENIAEDDPVEE